MAEIKMNPPYNRLIGDPPRIGIRPAVDGRRKGVRELLEDTTMGMARNVAQFLSDNLHHPNGLPVECVIADSCIGGVAEAAQTTDKFAREGVGLSLTVTPCWCYGSETMDMDPLIPKAVWGFNGTERPGLLARIKSVMRRMHARPAATGEASAHRSIAFGPCRLDLASHQLFGRDGAEIPITSMEFDLLRVFAENPGKALSRDRILTLTKNREWDPYDRSIDIRVARLRRKVEADPDNPLVIRTVRGVGYMFVSDT